MADLNSLPFFMAKSPPSCFDPNKDFQNKSNNNDNRIVKLCTYDWTIANYSMIMPIPESVSSPEFVTGINDDAMVKMVLSPTSDNNLKIDILLQKTKSVELVKLEKNFSFNKAVLNLEFLDSSGKILDYYIGLPYEAKYVNKMKCYAWKKEENISRFIENDSLTIRAKLSLSYPSVFIEANELSISKSIELLAKDMKQLIGGNIFPDLAVKVGGQSFLAHKAILFPQLPSITKLNSDMTNQHGIVSVEPSSSTTESPIKGYETIHIPNVNADVFLSILHYLYCGKMCSSDAAAEFGSFEFAKKYQLPELCRSLKPDEMQSRSVITPFKSGFYWYVKEYSTRSLEKFNLCHSPGYKFRVGNQCITWDVSLFFFDKKNIFLSLHILEGADKDIQTSFKLAVCNNDGTPYEERDFKHLFANSMLNSHPGFLDHESRFTIDPSMLHDDTLVIRCDITASDGQLTSDTNRIYPGDISNTDFKCWIKNLQNLWETENFNDVSLSVDEKVFKAHRFILSTRSPVFARMFESDMAEKLSGCVKIEDINSATMKCALTYIYTGKLGDLTMNHAPDLYRAADKYEILDLRDRCTEFIMDNMDVDSACEVMILSDLYNDKKMKDAAKNLICRRSSQALLTSHGLEMMTNYPQLAHDVLENLSAVYCSLPPQDAYENVQVQINATQTSTLVNKCIQN